MKCYQGVLIGSQVMTGSGYLRDAIEEPERIVAQAVEQLKDVGFDSLAGTGLSGALIVPRLASALGKPCLIVRKPDDLSAHSSYAAEGWIGRRWLFVDDKIVTGNTLRRVERAVARIAQTAELVTVCAGTYEYMYGTLKLQDAEPA